MSWTADPLPDWLRPPPRGFTADDLDRLPHTELIDGSLAFVSPQSAFHLLAMDLLETGLRRCVPDTVRVRREMTVTLDNRQRPEPDVLVINAAGNLDQTTYQAKDVVLTVEVVSPDSERRDRERKPQLYAQAGIRHFWRVENVAGRAAVYVYELDPATHAYALTGIHHDRLALTVPFDIDIDLTELDKL